MSIKRLDGDRARFYEVREGVWYKSYTTVLSMMPTSPFFIKWLKDHTAEEAEQLMTDAGLQGSKVHHAIDLILNGEVIFPSGFSKEQIDKEGLHEEELKKYLKKPFTKNEDKLMRGFINFYNDYKVKKIRSEFTVYSDKIRCAGTVDFFGTMELPEDGKKVRKLTVKQLAAGKIQEEQPRKKYNVIIDWKTGKGVYESHYRQVAGYYMALREMIKKKILVTIPNPQKVFLLHLGVNKVGYKLVEVTDIKEQYKRFCRVNDEWEDANPNAVPDSEYQYLESYKLLN